MVRFRKRLPLAHVVVATMFLLAPAAHAEPDSDAPASSSKNQSAEHQHTDDHDNGSKPAEAASKASTDGVALELNKLEASDKGCRAYVVINNKTDKTFQSYKIDLVLFQTDGIIGRRFSIDLAPLRPKKRSVKLFDIDGMSCDKIGSLLINDVMECKSEPESADSCLRDLSTTSLTNVQLSK